MHFINCTRHYVYTLCSNSSNTNPSQAKSCERHDTILGQHCYRHPLRFQYVSLETKKKMFRCRNDHKKSDINLINTYGQNDAEVTLILDTSMVHPIETMVMNKTTIKSMLMILSIRGGRTGVKVRTELVLGDVILNMKLSFCQKPRSSYA